MAKSTRFSVLQSAKIRIPLAYLLHLFSPAKVEGERTDVDL